MTVKELKEKLQQYPDDMEVFLCGGKTDFDYGLLNSCYKTHITMDESEDIFDYESEIDISERMMEVVILDEE